MQSSMTPARRTVAMAVWAIAWGGLLTAALTARQAPTAPTATPAAAALQAPDAFETRIRPLLAANCYACHGETAMGGLRLDTREGFFKGSDAGVIVEPGKPDASTLLKVVQHAAGYPAMPKGRAKLAPADIDVLTEWVRLGAVWPAPATAAATPVASHAKAITAEQRAFWSFAPLAAVPPPSVRDTAWPSTDIDRYVLARLEAEGLRPVADTDKRTLLRRTTIGLTGLPPTPEETDAFVADSSPEAFATVVDRLLASPRYGETWGRMWLDVARYGEDDYRSLDPMGRGYNPYPNAHLYRDWVIRAFNDDLPYDQFVTAQLAADLLPAADRVRHLPALGFLGLGPWYYDNGAVEITRADERHDRVDAVSRGLLGLTVGCARCHDHKYDPIPTTDYYALGGVFLNTEYHEYPLAPKAVVEEYKAKEKALKLKREMLAEFLRVEAEQLGATLAFESAKYMKAAWQVSGEPKKDKAEIIERDKLDYELFDRWLKFLTRPPTYYPFLGDWQALVARGGTAKEAETLATAFQDSGGRRRARGARGPQGERDHQGARAADGQAEGAREPAERVQDQRRLLSGLRPRAAQHGEGSDGPLPRRVRRRPRDRLVHPGPAVEPGPVALPRLGPGTAARSGAPRDDRRAPQGHRGDAESLAAEVRLRARRARSRDAGRPAGARPRQPDAPGRHRAPRVRQRAEPGRADAVHHRQRAARAGSHDRRPAHRRAGDGEPGVEGALRHRDREHAEQLRPERRAPDASGPARLPGAGTSSTTSTR